ncbi:hypothetical protein LMG27952_06836 [Paraburkholderia hiiakae]|uniref:Uncharacterized protein n=1 Tax=Paraburkholderia hiiakae TaxID=1081782 RepID=A0ABM8P8U6_9BURK|nr:hypothetical protein LMG27952_06836 [Paraburkholderia hiiakae]
MASNPAIPVATPAQRPAKHPLGSRRMSPDLMGYAIVAESAPETE